MTVRPQVRTEIWDNAIKEVTKVVTHSVWFYTCHRVEHRTSRRVLTQIKVQLSGQFYEVHNER